MLYLELTYTVRYDRMEKIYATGIVSDFTVHNSHGICLWLNDFVLCGLMNYKQCEYILHSERKNQNGNDRHKQTLL